MALIPVAMILQLLFGGAIVTVANMGSLVAPFSILVFSRWSFAGVGTIVDMNERIASDPVFSANNPYGLEFFDVRFGVTVAILLAFSAAFVAIAALLLRRRLE
jgi:hypothetical protein